MKDTIVSTTDFNNQLMELLCEEDTQDTANYCLISNGLLEEDYIKLACNHKFNYDPIFNEVQNQKKYTSLETQRLATNQIKCPYCRTIQNGILPYREGYIKINGINWPPKYQHLPNNCIYRFASGKRKNQPCNKKCLKNYCINHAKIMKNRKSKADKRAGIKANKVINQSTDISNIIIPPVETSVNQHLFGNSLFGDSSPVTLEKLWLPSIATKIHSDFLPMPHKTVPIWNWKAPLTPLPLGSTATNKNYFYHPLTQGPSNMPPPPPVPPQLQGCAYIFKRGKKKGEKCPCKKLYGTIEINKQAFCKTHYVQTMRSITKKKAKKEAIKMVNTLFPAPKINTAINIPIIKQSTIVPDSGYEYISSWEDLKSNSVIV